VFCSDLAYTFRIGTTKVLKRKRIDYDVVDEKMEVSEGNKWFKASRTVLRSFFRNNKHFCRVKEMWFWRSSE
jgi:hypothetical protein